MIHYIYRNPAGVLTEINSQVNLDRPSQALQVTTNAEQGSVGTASVTIEDPTGSLTLGGLRLFLIEDDQANWVRTWSGYTAERTFSRDIFRAGSAARVYDVALSDLNSVLYRRVLTDSTWNRPAETDVARMQALGTAGFLGDTTYLDTSGPVNMDAVDYRGQYVHDIIDDCAQQSGKNWFHLDVGTSGSTVFGTWYGLPTLTTFSSSLKLSNVLADVDNTTTFAAALDTKLVSDPSRVFSGVYMPYDGGAVYRTLPATATAFALGGRDTVAPAVNVKTSTKANARADRMLVSISTEEDTITTSFQCKSTYVNDIRAGMRVQCKFSHFTDYTSFTWMRVLNRTVTLLAPPDATGQARYEVALTLTPQTDPVIPTPPAIACSTAITGVAATLWDTGDVGPSVTPPYTITNGLTPASGTQPYLAFFMWEGRRTDTSAVTLDGGGMGNYTMTHNTREGNVSDQGSIGMYGYFAAAAGVTPANPIIQWTPSWTGGFTGGDSKVRGVGVLIPTASTTPLQKSNITISSSTITFPNPVTAGSLVIAGLIHEGSDPGLPVGWTVLANVSMAVGTGGTQLALIAKCMTGSEGATLTLVAMSETHWWSGVEIALT